MSNDFGKSISKEIVVGVVTALVTIMVTKACYSIYPDSYRVILSDTLRVEETCIPYHNIDSVLFNAISELSNTIKETALKKCVNNTLAESIAPARTEKQYAYYESDKPLLTVDKRTEKEERDYISTNSIIDKNGFYKKGYMISDGGAFFVLEKKPKVDDVILNFELRFFQSADVLSHIYLNICEINEKGELHQFFSQTYEVRDGLNRILIANNLHTGKNRIEIGVFLKSEEGKDYPVFYRNVFILLK